MRNSLIILSLILTSCSPLFPPQLKAEQNIFFLSDIENFEESKRQNINLVIEEVETNAGLDTDKIAKTSSNMLSYYEDSKWAGKLNEVVLSTLVESFENSGKFESVTNELRGIRGQYAISANIRDFQIVDDSSAKVKIATKLIGLPTREVLMNFISQDNQQISSNQVGAAVSKLDLAFENVQKDIVEKVSAYIAEKTASNFKPTE